MATPTTSSQALSQLNQAQKTEQSPQQFLTGAEQKYGVPGAQQQVTGLQQAINNTTKVLNNVAPSVMGRTGNSLVTSAQANAQIANEQAPINTQLQQQNQDFTTAKTAYDQAEQQAQTLAAGNQQAQTDRVNYLQNIYNALYKKESDAAQLAEQQREANMAAAAKSSAANDSAGISAALAAAFGGGNSAAATAPKASYGLKVANDPTSGYYFRDSNGGVINALQYAKSTGTDFKTLVQKMADSGDRGAQAVLPYIKGNTIRAGVLSPALIKAFTG